MQGFDLLECFTRAYPLPVLCQLCLMKLGPREYEAKLSTLEAAADDLEMWSLKYMVIVIPKKRLMVGTTP
jgi:hypothetical protein